MSDVSIAGFAAPGFERVESAFRRSVETGDDLGANVAVFVRGECVVDLVGGHSNRDRSALWSPHHLARIYSSGKAVIAMLAARAVSQGLLDYESPVVRYWPKFGGGGKADITVGETLSHQAGLCGVPDEMPSSEWSSWDAICARIEAMTPVAPPRVRSSYAPQLFGHVAGEILRRATGRTIRDMLAEDFHSRLGMQIFCGVPESEMTRVVSMQKPPRAPDYGEITRCTELAFLKPWSAPSRMAPKDLMAANIPASNIYSDARSLAELVQPLADDGRLRGERVISERALAEALKVRIASDDLVLPFHISWAAGVMRNAGGYFGPSATAYGHAGWGGSAVMFDPTAGLSVAYIMNKMSEHLVGDPRAVRIFAAAGESLASK